MPAMDDPAQPRPTRHTFGDAADPRRQVHVWTDDGDRWHVTDHYGRWLDERGRWDWRPAMAREDARAWRDSREWDLDTALGRARAAYREETGDV